MNGANIACFWRTWKPRVFVSIYGRSILQVRVWHVDRFTVTNLSYISIIQLLLPATSHHCQYFENGTRLISIATASRISALQTPQRHAALSLRLTSQRSSFFLFIQLFLVPVSIMQLAIPLSWAFFRIKWNCLEIAEIAAGGLYLVRFLAESRERRDGQWNSPRNKMTGETQASRQ